MNGLRRSLNGALVIAGAFIIVAGFASMARVSPWAMIITLVGYTTGLVGFTEVLVHAIPLTLLGLVSLSHYGRAYSISVVMAN